LFVQHFVLLHKQRGGRTMNQISRRSVLKGLAAASVVGLSISAQTGQAQSYEMVYLRHEFSGRYMASGDTHNGGRLHLWAPIPEGHELRYTYTLISVGGDYYYLRHQHSGRYVCSGDAHNGGRIHLWGPIPRGHEPRYRFQLIALGCGYYYLRHQYSGKYVVSGALDNNGDFWLWGPIPESHEARYKFRVISV
jgi:hypothetical protein